MPMHWYAVQVKPHKERIVGQVLENQKLEIFCPMVKVNPKNPRAAKKRPYFPGYLFVNVDLEAYGANTLNWTPGVNRLVGFGGEAAVVPPHLIHELQRRILKVNLAGGLVFDQLKPGDKVRIKHGPFAGYEAIFDMQEPGKERVRVLLAFLSTHPQPVELDSADIEKK